MTGHRTPEAPKRSVPHDPAGDDAPSTDCSREPAPSDAEAAEASGRRRIDRRRLLIWGGFGVAAAAVGTAVVIPLVTEEEDTEPLVLDEDFSGDSLDTDVWTARNDTYFDRDWGWLSEKNVSVQENVLTLRAHRMEHPRRTPDGRVRRWSSAEISSQGKFAIEYGRWEFEMKQPVAPRIDAGFWTALWLRPENSSAGGEIDVVEGYGSKSPNAETSTDPTERAQSTVHFNQKGTNKVFEWSPRRRKLSEEWTRWRLERTPDGVRIHCEDQEILHVPSDHADYAAAFPSGTRMHLRISFQVGNPYWGRPDEESQDHPQLQVRRLKVWEYKKGKPVARG